MEQGPLIQQTFTLYCVPEAVWYREYRGVLRSLQSSGAHFLQHEGLQLDLRKNFLLGRGSMKRGFREEVFWSGGRDEQVQSSLGSGFGILALDHHTPEEASFTWFILLAFCRCQNLYFLEREAG